MFVRNLRLGTEQNKASCNYEALFFLHESVCYPTTIKSSNVIEKGYHLCKIFF